MYRFYKTTNEYQDYWYFWIVTDDVDQFICHSEESAIRLAGILNTHKEVKVLPPDNSNFRDVKI